jgi:hypothetical protein
MFAGESMTTKLMVPETLQAGWAYLLSFSHADPGWHPRNGVICMLLALLALHSLAGPGPVPVRVPLHFKISAKTTTVVDLSAMGQPSQNVIMTVGGFVSATTTDSAGGVVASIVVDSSTFDAGEFTAALPPEMTASSKGTVFHVFLVNGRPAAAVSAKPATVQSAQLLAGVELLLAGLRPRTANESWVDTAKTDTTVAQGTAAGTRITTWKASPGTAGRIQLDGSYTGTTTVGAGPMSGEMKMTGTSHVLAMPGMLSESGTLSGGGQANMNMQGQSIPMKVTMEVTATAIP